MQLNLGSLPYIIISSAEIAKEVLKTHEMSFCNRLPNAAIRFLTYDASDLGFSPYGTFWKFMKKMCMTELLNGKMLDQLYPIREQEIKLFLAAIQRKTEEGEGVTVNVGQEASRLVNNVVMRMAISKSCFFTGDEAREVTERVKEASKLCGMFNLSDYFWFCEKVDLQGIGKRLKNVRERFDTIMEMIIEEHQDERKRSKSRLNQTPKDILDVLLTVSEDETSEVKITRDNIKGFLMVITNFQSLNYVCLF